MWENTAVFYSFAMVFMINIFYSDQVIKNVTYMYNFV